MIQIFFDGLCQPVNPGGTATYGFVITMEGKTLHEGKGVVGEGSGMTNNVAEYTGLLEALKYVATHHVKETKISIYGDSQLVIRQLKGEYKARSETAKKYLPMVRKLLEGKQATFTWVPREQNTAADELTKAAYSGHLKKKQQAL
ncbi:ribonuclease HI family protein [Candidatus Woesearchaeota archaeon]|nr:ribonuclease HI family protein [Candidatus Woesearchaeota archaeon]